MTHAPCDRRPALACGAAGITFEIDEDEILAGEQHLIEVKITMQPDAIGAEARFAQRLENFAQPRLRAEQLLCRTAHLVWHGVQIRT